MRATTIFLTTAVTLALVSPASAQDRPDFSGSWALAESTGGIGGRMLSGAPGQAPQGAAATRAPGQARQGGGAIMMRGGLGQTVTITQAARTLVIVQTTPQGEIRSTYNLDGSPSRNALNLPGGRTEVISTARWEDNALVIVTPNPMDDGASRTFMTLSLNAGGDLFVETVRVGAAGAAEPMVGVYRRP